MSVEGARKRARRLQERICGTQCPLDDSAEKILEQLKRGLLAGFHSDHLRTPPTKIAKMLQIHAAPPKDRGYPVHEIVGGHKDFARTSHAGLFERRDGALFNFAITVARRPKRQPLDLLAYNFELRFPETYPARNAPRFVRFDLNKPGHSNSDAGLRCHLHPGHDDLQAPRAPIGLTSVAKSRICGASQRCSSVAGAQPAPSSRLALLATPRFRSVSQTDWRSSVLLAPVEVLELFLYGLTLPERSRSK